MVIIESGVVYKFRDEDYFYAWIKDKHNSTVGKASWESEDSVGYLIKYLTLKNLKIGVPKIRSNYILKPPFLLEQLDTYKKELKDFIL